MFQTEDAILTAIKKVLDELTVPSLPAESEDGSALDSPLFSRKLSPTNQLLNNQSPARGKGDKVGCLNPILLILFELKAGTPDDGWNLHETIK